MSTMASRREDDLDREIQSHLDLEAAEQREAGLPPDRARLAAQRALGNTASIKETTRDVWGWTFWQRLRQDLLYATRTFARNPGFVAITVLSLALGIGGNAAMFSLVNALLIRPLPYTDPGRLVRITSVYPQAGLVLFQGESRTMEVASAGPANEVNLTRAGQTFRVAGSTVSDNLFSVLGVPPAVGRGFQPGDQRPGADRLIVLSYEFWKTAFGSDPRTVGSVVTVDDIPRQVVGVMPEGFRFPAPKIQFWIPARVDPTNVETYWGGTYAPLIARLRPGATIAQAGGEVHSMMEHLRARYPFPMPRNFNADSTAIPLQTDLVSQVRGKLTVLFAAVGTVLLIACANVSSLLLARAAARQKEIALRAALGASRLRILRQLLTESLFLAVLGAGAGLFLARTALSIFKSALPSGTGGIAAATLDWQVAGFVAGLAALSGLAFGLLPSLHASRVDLAGAMKTGTARALTPAGVRLRSAMMVGEIALTVLLLVAAGLLLKSLYSMSQVNPGFQPEHILTMRLNPNQSMCAHRQSCISLYDRLLERARGISGAAEVAAANSVPLDGSLPNLPVDVENHPKSADFPAPLFWTGAVTPGYFHLLRIPLLAGRLFTASDSADAAAVAVVSASTARRYWPGESAIGKHIRPVFETKWRTIVGVVNDVRQFNLEGSEPGGIGGEVYMPYAQAVEADRQIPAAMSLLVKTGAEPASVAAEVRRIARDLNPDTHVAEVTPFQEIVSATTADFRSTMWLFLSFAASALILACVGIYGLVSNAVAQRTYEIGLRVALGATRAEILRLMLGQSLRLTMIGVGAGVLASLALTRFLAGMLFEVAATDAATYAAVCALLLTMAVLASYLPAWRAAYLDPVRSLRAE